MKTFKQFKDTRSAIQYVQILILIWIPRVFTKVSPFVVREMKFFKIMPDLVSEVPPFVCQIDYGIECADFGNLVVPNQVDKEPKETFWPTDEGKMYTLMMVGLDSPSRMNPYLREYLHWLVVNIKGDKFDFGDCKAPYLKPESQEDGEHRYAFLVFEQPKRWDIAVDVITKKAEHSELRGKFSWREFAKKHDLGKPYAINFFRAEKPEPLNKKPKKPVADNSDGWFPF